MSADGLTCKGFRNERGPISGARRRLASLQQAAAAPLVWSLDSGRWTGCAWCYDVVSCRIAVLGGLVVVAANTSESC